MQKNSIRTHSDAASSGTEIPECTRETLILQHLNLVRAISWNVAQRLPRSVSTDDLASAGTLGLIAAADRFDSSRGLAFSTYARHRIMGAILDFLRTEDPLSRSARRAECGGAPVTVSLDQLTTPPAAHLGPRIEDRVDVGNARKCLSPRENRVISLLYDQDWPAREVAKLLGVNESRISQIKHRAVTKLRSHWN